MLDFFYNIKLFLYMIADELPIDPFHISNELELLIEIPKKLKLESSLFCDHVALVAPLSIKKSIQTKLTSLGINRSKQLEFQSVVVAKELSLLLKKKVEIPILKTKQGKLTPEFEFFFLDSIGLKDHFFKIFHLAFRFAAGITPNEIKHVMATFYANGFKLVGEGYNPFDTSYTEGVMLIYLKNEEAYFKIEILIDGKFFATLNEIMKKIYNTN